MRIGELNKLVTIQYQTKATDSMGGFTVTWADLGTVWAAIWPVSAKETVQAGQNIMAITARVRIRYRSGFKPDWRIKYGDKYFSISSIINPEMRNEWLDLLCREVA
jgi:SPP1 family predicted phage head-tail adaptor